MNGPFGRQVEFESTTYPIANLFKIDRIYVYSESDQYKICFNGGMFFINKKNNYKYATDSYINNFLLKTINKSSAYMLCSEDVQKYVDLFCANDHFINLPVSECTPLIINDALTYIMYIVICEFLYEQHIIMESLPTEESFATHDH